MFEPAELVQVVHAGGLEREHHLRQVQTLHLGLLLHRPVAMLLLAPQPITFPRCGAPGPTSPLVRAGLRDLLDQQRVDAAIGIKARDAGQAGIDDQSHAVDGQRGFGDIRRHHHLALLIPGHGGVLVVRVQLAVQRQAQEAFRLRALPDGLDGARDFKRAGHEHQHVALPPSDT